MKKWFFILAASFSLSASGYAQTGNNKLPAVDKSPMDMIYFPVEYPVLKIKDKASDPLVARVIYSRPQKNNRPIFGELVDYNSVWRLGANEATEIEFYKEVKIGSKKIPKGRYTLFAIVRPTTWTIIVNKDTDTWGAFKYDEKKDVVRVDVSVKKAPEVVDAFTMNFAKTTSGAELLIAWDTVMVSLPIETK
jgi:hypothetical protein